ncbi:MAG TPA: hypothetical protein VHV57_20445 [Acidimicrobiales bacterium]|nr:hypothetical protein [Acidimicrobiales bacterium]
MPHRRLRSLMPAVIVACGALCLSGGPVLAAEPTSSATAQSWYESVESDLSPLQSTLVSGLQVASSWQAGHVSAAKVRRKITLDLPSIETALATVSGLAPLPGYTEAKQNIVDGLTLYVQSFSVIRAATLVRSAALVTQLQRASARIRELGDVSFDEGTAEIAPLLGPALVGDDVHAAMQIPNWSAQRLAPGEPLIGHWTGTSAQPAMTQSAATWSTAIARSGAPRQTSVRGAVLGATRGRTAHLAELAAAVDRAEVALSGVPGLDGYPQASALLRLALLVDAEALLVKEASVLSHATPAAELSKISGALVSVGGSLRSEQ